MSMNMNKTLAILGGIGAGAAAMYFLDPDRGRSRRAMISDKATGLKNDARQAIEGKATDLKNRAQGLAHEAKGLVGGDSSARHDAGTANTRSGHEAGTGNSVNTINQGRMGTA